MDALIFFPLKSLLVINWFRQPGCSDSKQPLGVIRSAPSIALLRTMSSLPLPLIPSCDIIRK